MVIQKGPGTGTIFEFVISVTQSLKKTKHLDIESVYCNFHGAKCFYSAVQPSESEPRSPQIVSSSSQQGCRVQAAFCSPNNYTLICNVKWV